ncbi:La-related protein 4 [Halocaridina rubra]|uniref:La-related protein 4 n=1 Tax=Halocaridina rubra TaxID=373956 RepID=A0AAN8X610_HALRR
MTLNATMTCNRRSYRGTVDYRSNQEIRHSCALYFDADFIYPFMNGDVGKQYCGVCPPTPDTPSMVVESPVEAPASSDLSTGAAVQTENLILTKVPVADVTKGMAAAAAQNSEQEGNSAPEGCAVASLVGIQQNGEIPLEASRNASECSVPSLPTPSVPSPVPSTSSEVSPETPGEVECSDHTSGNATEVPLVLTEATGETQGTQTTAAQTLAPIIPVGQPQPSSQPQALTRDQIQQKVAEQVEYFFSRENLSNDPYLISQMDSDQYVPVFILANCSQFKNITKDHSIIVEALKKSPYVQLDEENNRVRPNYQRCIVILREIPESTPVEEIEAVFKSDECPKVVSLEFVHNSSWYVTFESTEDAKKAFWFLRGTVQTFKGKPILARIKTKPISRLGCLSVLPSYGGKGGSEGKDGSGPPPTPGSAGLPPGPGTPQQSTPGYNAPPGRFIYTPTSVTPTSYNTTYAVPPTPTAYFYPNMVQWTQPSGFYDINGFLQFNGLSPQAAFKPPTSNSVRYNSNRSRNNKREGNRYDKGHSNSSGNQSTTGGSTQSGHMGGGHFHPNQRQPYRPQSSQSPSLSSHRPSHLPPHSNCGAPPPPPPPPPPSSISSPPLSTVSGNNHPNHLSFAQCDLTLASQSDLYTSFSPPTGPAPQVVHNDKKEVVTVTKSSTSSSQPLTSSASTTNSQSSTAPLLNATTSSVSSTTLGTTQGVSSDTSLPAIATSAAQIPSSHQVSAPQPPPHHHVQPQPPGPPHRGSYNEFYHFHHHHHNMPRDPQPPRQLQRNARRRPRGRDDETMSSGGNRGAPQRGMASQTPVTDSKSGNNSQESTPPPPPPPQFDLQANAFPPLPGSDEQVPVTEEKRPSEPLVSPWGSDNQRFSDVMKGTAKPRPPSQSSINEKDLIQDCVTSTSTSSPSTAVASSPSVTTATTTQASQVSSSTATTSVSPPQGVPATVPTSSSSSNTTLNSSTISALPNSNSQTTVSGSKQNDTRPMPRDQRGVRDERRSGASGGHRERRDYARDHPRDYQRDHHRDTTRSGNNARDRDREYYRSGRENSGRTGKENRPLPSRQGKEDKADAEGWIKIGRDFYHRESNCDVREAPKSKETRMPLVNGDSSPLHSPKAPSAEVQTSSVGVENNTEEKVPCSQALNNNDGERKKTWAKMALASKDEMERLAAELKEKEEQEKKLRFHARPQAKPQASVIIGDNMLTEKVSMPRDREGKTLRRDGPPRENRLSSERGGPQPFRPRDSTRPKSPK